MKKEEFTELEKAEIAVKYGYNAAKKGRRLDDVLTETRMVYEQLEKNNKRSGR